MGLFRIESRLLARTVGHLEYASYAVYSVRYDEVTNVCNTNRCNPNL